VFLPNQVVEIDGIGAKRGSQNHSIEERGRLGVEQWSPQVAPFGLSGEKSQQGVVRTKIKNRKT